MKGLHGMKSSEQIKWEIFQPQIGKFSLIAPHHIMQPQTGLQVVCSSKLDSSY